MNPLAAELNQTIEDSSPDLMRMLSAVGRQLFFPKGILSQSAEAKEKAHRMNATAGIAMENRTTMCFASTMTYINLDPAESLTYAPSYGLAELREVWRAQLMTKNPSLAGKRISLPVVTSGITNGISVFADMWLDAGDVVLLPDPMWGNYNMILNVRKGARLQPYAMFTDDFRFNLPAFEAAVQHAAQQHPKVTVLLNFPHNPSGYTVSMTEADAIVNVLTECARAGTDVIAVTDDSYFGLFYDDLCLHESIFARLADTHPRLLAVKLDGCTKENFAWGLRVGFITYSTRIDRTPLRLYEALEKKTAGCIRGNISNAAHLSQRVVLKSMADPRFEEEKREKFSILKRRAQRVKTVLADSKYQAAWRVYPFNSGYFMCLQLKTVDAERLRRHLLDEYGVGLIAIGEKNLRVAFSCIEEEEISEMFDIILKGVNDLG